MKTTHGTKPFPLPAKSSTAHDETKESETVEETQEDAHILKVGKSANGREGRLYG